MTSLSTSSIALLLITLPLFVVGTAQATDEIYKQVDAHGKVTYSNRPIKGGKKVDLPALSTLSTPKPPSPPKAEAQAAPAPTERHNRKELLEAIAKEEKALDAAKLAAKAGAEKPEVYRHTKTIVGKDGKTASVTTTGRNVAAYEEKMKKLNEEVALHEKSLAALKTELAGLGEK